MEVIETMTVNGEAARFASFNPPRLEFINKWFGGCPPAVVAHDRTGSNPVTGEWTLGIGLRNRSNGMVRVEASLWKLNLDLNDSAQGLLLDYWWLLNEAMPGKVRRRMKRRFSKSFFEFDATPEQVEDWREFLGEVLTDRASYTDIGGFVAKRNQ